MEYLRKKWIDIIPYLAFMIGVIMDIIMHVKGIHCITVSEAYMDCIFAGIITISILCFTFVTLISSFLDNRYLGYRLKDVIRFPDSPVNLKEYIRISLLAIIIGVCLLGINFKVDCVNSMTALLIALVLLEGNVAFKIYEMITDEGYVTELVGEHFIESANNNAMTLKEFQSHTDTILRALSTAINEGNYVEKDKTCEMLACLGTQMQKRSKNEGYYDYYKYFDAKLRAYIDGFAKVFGYNEMVETIVKIYMKMSDFEYGRRELYIIPPKNMRFWNDQLLLENNYFKQIIEIDLLNIYKEKKITNAEIERILYVYFDSLMNNKLCTENVRKQLAEEYIAALIKLQWNTNEKGSEPDVNGLLNVVKYFVLKNNNINDRNYIFQVIIRQAFYNNMPYNKEKYFDFLSLFFQAFYAFIFREGETLTEDYREGLKDTFVMEFSSESIVKMSAPLLLRINIQEILCAIGRRVQRNPDSQERRFENFPQYMMAKTVVWTSEFDIDFMLMLFIIFNDEVRFYSIYECFFDWKSISDEYKINILREFQEQFDTKTGLLKDSFVTRCKEYENLLRHSGNVTEQLQKMLFDYIAIEYANLIQRKIYKSESQIENIDDRAVMSKIDELMRKDGIFGWNPQYSSDFYVKFAMPDYISRKEYRTIQSTARTIQRGIIEAVRSYIRQCGNKFLLSFDVNGIKNMHTFICDNKYDARNYTYTNDWAIAKFREEPEFVELEEEEKKIEFVGTPQIYDNLYFYKDKFHFNVKISKIEFLDLSEKECAEFIEDSKGYNGLYNVDGALLPKEEAMRIVKKIYCKERYGFKLMIGLRKGDITYIDFKH